MDADHNEIMVTDFGVLVVMQSTMYRGIFTKGIFFTDLQSADLLREIGVLW